MQSHYNARNSHQPIVTYFIPLLLNFIEIIIVKQRQKFTWKFKRTFQPHLSESLILLSWKCKQMQPILPTCLIDCTNKVIRNLPPFVPFIFNYCTKKYTNKKVTFNHTLYHKSLILYIILWIHWFQFGSLNLFKVLLDRIHAKVLNQLGITRCLHTGGSQAGTM